MTVCARCGDEVRWGNRPGLTSPFPPGGFWMHREPADHPAILGQMELPEWRAADEAALDEPRTITVTKKGVDSEVLTTTREFDFKKMSKARREAAEADEEDDAEPEEIPLPEVYATPIDITDDRLPGGAKTKINLGLKNGWSWTAHYSRGPRVHASQGTLLGVADFVVVRLRLDGALKRAVASWSSASDGFLGAWLLTYDHDTDRYITSPANSDQLKAWLKHEEDA